MLLQVVEITAPVFLLASIGYIWARSGVAYDMAFVTRMGVNLAVPCLVFSVLAQAEIEPQAFSDIAIAAIAAHILLWALFWGVLSAAELPISTYQPPMVFANTGNMGLAVCLFAYGDTGLALAMVIFAISAGLSFSIGVWIVAKEARATAALRQPIVYACILGIVFAWQGWTLPNWLMGGISLVGQIGIPLMLITLGVSVSLLKVGDIGRAVVLSLLKTLVCAAVGLVIAAVFGLDGTVRGVLILQMVMPAGITTYIIAQRYGADPQAVAGLVVVSTVMSIAVIPAALAFLLSGPPA